MTDLPRLTPQQRTIVEHWLPNAELVADLSWELMGTAVLLLRTAEGDRIVKAGGPTNHHIGRERNAHLEFTGPLVAQRRAARMLRYDLDADMLLVDYLPGELVQGTPSENDPGTYYQAGSMLAVFHGQASRRITTMRRNDSRRRSTWLDPPHRIAPEMAERLRAILLSAKPEPVVLVPTHGDWQPRNWLIDGDFVRAIDFGRFDWRPAFTDFARLAVRQFAANPSLEAAFLDGYGSDPRTSELWNILLVREAIGTAVWAYQVGDETIRAGRASDDRGRIVDGAADLR